MSSSGTSSLTQRMHAVLSSPGASADEKAERLLAILEEDSDDGQTAGQRLLAAFRSGSAGASGSSGQDLAARFVDLLDGDGSWGSSGLSGLHARAAQVTRNSFYSSLLSNMRGSAGSSGGSDSLPSILLLGMAAQDLYSAWGASGQLIPVICAEFPLPAEAGNPNVRQYARLPDGRTIFYNHRYYTIGGVTRDRRNPDGTFTFRIVGTSGTSGLVYAREDSEEYFRAHVLPHFNTMRAMGYHGVSGDNDLMQFFMDALREDDDEDDDSAMQRLARMLLDAIAEENTNREAVASGRRQPTKLDALIALADAYWDVPDAYRRRDRDEYYQMHNDGWAAIGRRLDATEPPWSEGHRLDINARGGLYYRERDRVTVAAELYDSRVFGNLDVDVENDYEFTVDGDVTIGLQAPTGSSGAAGSSGTSGSSSASGTSGSAETSGTPRPTSTPAAPVGVDRLTVGGTARFEFNERKTMLTGTVNRLWEGPIVRMVGMDGIICGGVFGRIHAGPSFTFAPLASSDVYGGAAHVSAARIHAAMLGYRSADATAWAMLAYIRAAKVTIEPLLGTPSQTTPFRDAKLASKLWKLSLALCPFLDILVGLVLLLPMLLWALVKKIYGVTSPPAGPPRIRNRSAGFTKEVAASVLHV